MNLAEQYTVKSPLQKRKSVEILDSKSIKVPFKVVKVSLPIAETL